MYKKLKQFGAYAHGTGGLLHGKIDDIVSIELSGLSEYRLRLIIVLPAQIGE